MTMRQDYIMYPAVIMILRLVGLLMRMIRMFYVLNKAACYSTTSLRTA